MNKKILGVAMFLLLQMQVFAQNQKWETVLENDVEWIGLSFVRKAEDIIDLKRIISRSGRTACRRPWRRRYAARPACCP